MYLVTRKVKVEYEEVSWFIGWFIAYKYPKESEPFHCWMCYDYTTLRPHEFLPLEDAPLVLDVEVDIHALVHSRTQRLVDMITKASGGYKRMKIISEDQPMRLYCTPHNVVIGLTLTDTVGVLIIYRMYRSAF